MRLVARFSPGVRTCARRSATGDCSICPGDLLTGPLSGLCYEGTLAGAVPPVASGRKNVSCYGTEFWTLIPGERAASQSAKWCETTLRGTEWPVSGSALADALQTLRWWPDSG